MPQLSEYSQTLNAKVKTSDRLWLPIASFSKKGGNPFAALKQQDNKANLDCSEEERKREEEREEKREEEREKEREEEEERSIKGSSEQMCAEYDDDVKDELPHPYKSIRDVLCKNPELLRRFAQELVLGNKTAIQLIWNMFLNKRIPNTRTRMRKYSTREMDKHVLGLLGLKKVSMFDRRFSSTSDDEFVETMSNAITKMGKEEQFIIKETLHSEKTETLMNAMNYFLTHHGKRPKHLRKKEDYARVAERSGYVLSEVVMPTKKVRDNPFLLSYMLFTVKE